MATTKANANLHPCLIMLLMDKAFFSSWYSTVFDRHGFFSHIAYRTPVDTFVRHTVLPLRPLPPDCCLLWHYVGRRFLIDIERWLGVRKIRMEVGRKGQKKEKKEVEKDKNMENL